MAIQNILIGKDQKVLRTKTKKVTSFTKDLQKLIEDLLDTVHAAEGAGLAAPQIGISQRVTIARIGEEFVPLVNPEILWKSDQVIVGEEGCLSLPDIWLQIPRAKEIVLRFSDEKGEEHERKLEGFDARVVQHEVDHLDGILIVDYQSKKNE
ncbi:MAG TPA: peptide deformylase [Candidatus Peribacterales bacterium]|nr:peptide deformylase [Candidatus Peribacterales bacterium]